VTFQRHQIGQFSEKGSYSTLKIFSWYWRLVWKISKLAPTNSSQIIYVVQEWPQNSSV